MWIRQVLVPGYTDKKEDLILLREFISNLKTVEKVEILPYHDMGRHKWEELGFKYDLDGVRTATDDDIENAKEVLKINYYNALKDENFKRLRNLIPLEDE